MARVQRRFRIHGGLQRVAVKDVLDIRQQELLVLLLMIQSEHDQVCGFLIVLFRCQKPLHGLIDMLAVMQDFPDGRPGQQTAFCSRMHVASRVVIGIEKIVVTIVEDLVVTHMRR